MLIPKFHSDYWPLHLMTLQPDIDTLDKQTQTAESAPDIIELKRAQNGLLRILPIPSEILARIFKFTVTDPPEPYNFLLVCHRWCQVAYDSR